MTFLSHNSDFSSQTLLSILKKSELIHSSIHPSIHTYVLYRQKLFEIYPKYLLFIQKKESQTGLELYEGKWSVQNSFYKIPFIYFVNKTALQSKVGRKDWVE